MLLSVKIFSKIMKIRSAYELQLPFGQLVLLSIQYNSITTTHGS